MEGWNVRPDPASRLRRTADPQGATRSRYDKLRFDRFRLHLSRSLGEDRERLGNLRPLFGIQAGGQLVHPAITLFNAVFDQSPAFAGQRDVPDAAVTRALGPPDEAALDEFLHELAGRGGADLEAVADAGDIAGAAVMELHQDAELRHGHAGGPGVLRPAAHRAMRDGVHPFAQDAGELGRIGHRLRSTLQISKPAHPCFSCYKVPAV